MGETPFNMLRKLMSKQLGIQKVSLSKTNKKCKVGSLSDTYLPHFWLYKETLLKSRLFNLFFPH